MMTNSNKVLLETVWNLNWLLWEFLYLFYYGGYVCAHNVEGTYMYHGTCDEDNVKLSTVGHLLHFLWVQEMECSMPGFQCKCLYLLSHLTRL